MFNKINELLFPQRDIKLLEVRDYALFSPVFHSLA